MSRYAGPMAPFWVFKDKKLKNHILPWIQKENILFDQISGLGFDKNGKPIIFLKQGESVRAGVILCSSEECREIALEVLEKYLQNHHDNA